MKFDIKKLISVANAVTNPKEAIGMGLNMLSKSNPDMANMIATMIKSGENPAEAITKFAQEGQFSTKELNYVKNIYAIAKKTGYKGINVPDDVWKEAENAINKSSTTKSSRNTDWF